MSTMIFYPMHADFPYLFISVACQLYYYVVHVVPVFVLYVFGVNAWFLVSGVTSAHAKVWPSKAHAHILLAYVTSTVIHSDSNVVSNDRP